MPGSTRPKKKKPKAPNHSGTIRTYTTKTGEKRYAAVMMINGEILCSSRQPTPDAARTDLVLKIAHMAHAEQNERSTEATLATLAPIYLEGKPTAHRETNTNELSKYAWKSVEEILGPLRPSEIDAKALHFAVARVEGNGNTKNRYQREIAAILAYFGNPLPELHKFPKAPEPEIRILTLDEQKKLVASAYLPQTKLAIEIMLDTGIRPGELCGLMHEDIDGDGFWVKRSRPRVGSKPQIKATKTAQSRAWVPLTDRLRKQLGPPKEGFVIQGFNKNPFGTDRLRKAILKIADDAGIGEVTPNELRHTAAVNMLAAGVDPATVASITRHSVKTLLKMYYRGSNELKRLAMQRTQNYTG